MIVVVEGPSAAGKTTWVVAHGESSVLYEPRYPGPPTDASDDAQAAYWARTDSERWADALEIEARVGLVLCDGDPLKLHYQYCLARIGEVSQKHFSAGVAAIRREIAEKRLGVADLILCSIPDDATLGLRKDGDTTRSRSRFELHRRLAEPLRAWYSTLDALDPGRVVWSFPESLEPVPPRIRYDVTLFDAWMTALPWNSN